MAIFTTITGASGAPTTYTGTDGVDLITLVNPGASVLQAEAGSDVINVSLAGQNGATVNTASNQTLRGGQGDDAFTITGGNLINSVIAGNLGNDTFIGSVIASTIQGGQGNDTVTLSSSNGGAFVNGNLGNDTLTAIAAATYSSSSLLGGQGNDTITLGSGGANVIAQGVRLEGNLGNDTITINALVAASSVGVTATGGAGNDVINAANAGIATALFGGDGNDTLTADGSTTGSVTGGEGVDTITGTAQGTTIDLTETTQLLDTATITGVGANGLTVAASTSVTSFSTLIGVNAGNSTSQKDLITFGVNDAILAGQAATAITANAARTSGQLVSSYTVGLAGNTTFTLGNGSSLSISDGASLGAAVAGLYATDIGAAGQMVMFNGSLSGTSYSWIYQQTATTTGAVGGYTLARLDGTYNGLEGAASTTSGYVFVS